MKIKRLLGAFLCVATLLSLFACRNDANGDSSAPETTAPPPSPVEDFEYEVITVSENLKYILENGDYSDTYIDIVLDSEGLLCITKYLGTDKNVVIPAEIDGIAVYSIGCEAFANTQVETVWLPESVGNIVDRAFCELSTLTAVYGGKGLRMIGEKAFADCHNLTTIDLSSDTLQILLYRAFHSCFNLTGIELSSSLTEIGSQVFAYCRSIQSVTIPGTVTKWGDECFAACKSMSSLTLEEGLTTIRGSYFYIAYALTTLTIPASVTDITDASLFRSGDFPALTEIIFKGNAPTLHSTNFRPSDLIIYYDPDTEGWDTSVLRDYFTLVPID